MSGPSWQADFDILTALVTITRDCEDRGAAVDYAKRLVRAAPNGGNAKALLDS